MNVPRSAVGLTGKGTVDVLNLRLDLNLIDDLRTRSGFAPGYHMNKMH